MKQKVIKRFCDEDDLSRDIFLFFIFFYGAAMLFLVAVIYCPRFKTKNISVSAGQYVADQEGDFP